MRPPVAKLILVDGFAGAGKSTLAQQVWLNLVRGGRDAIWLHEHESRHPIFQYGEVEELLQLTPGPFEDRLLAGWAATAGDAGGSAVRIVEGSFVQIPVGVMLSMNVPVKRIRTLLRRIESAIGGAGAALVYLFHADLRAALLRIGDIRGAPWLDAVTAALAQSPYGRTHRVRNIDGLVEYYRRQRAIVDSVFPTLTIRRLAIDVSGARWDRYHRQIATFLGIRRVSPRQLRPADLLRHVGPYCGMTTGNPCLVTTDAHALYMHLPATGIRRLIRVIDGHFCVESLPIDVRFIYDRKGQARRFEYKSRMVNEVLSETSWARV